MNDLSLIEDSLEELSIDLVVLAGFLLKIPTKIIKKYSNKIINVHPSLAFQNMEVKACTETMFIGLFY